MASRLGAIFLLLTAFSVFAWGTSYKLSLYKSAAEQVKTPKAKLCTRASEAAKSQVEASVSRDHDSAAFSLRTVVELSEPLEQPAQNLPSEGLAPIVLPALHYVPALYLRPPPSA